MISTKESLVPSNCLYKQFVGTSNWIVLANGWCRRIVGTSGCGQQNNAPSLSRWLCTTSVTLVDLAAPINLPSPPSFETLVVAPPSLLWCSKFEILFFVQFFLNPQVSRWATYILCLLTNEHPPRHNFRCFLCKEAYVAWKSCSSVIIFITLLRGFPWSMNNCFMMGRLDCHSAFEYCRVLGRLCSLVKGNTIESKELQVRKWGWERVVFCERRVTDLEARKSHGNGRGA